MTILDLTQLSFVTGGQAAGSQPSSSSVEDRVRDAVREELDSREHEELREYERKHPFTALMCQGDLNCLRDARR